MESFLSVTAAPKAQPVAAYVGGKRNLAKRLAALIEATPHTTYAEPFVGMGGVFLRRSTRPRAEIINDWSRDVANLFRVLQRHHGPFLELLAFQLTTRADFDRQKAVDPETLTDLERAVRFLYLQKTAFGGKVIGRNFGMHTDSSGEFNITKLAPMLEALHRRLAGVTIEQLPFDAFIRRFDAPGTLFYVDPPYYGSEDYYGAELFSRADFTKLRDSLAAVKGAFILSINDVPQIREIFAAFEIQEAATTYGLQRGAATGARELIITSGISQLAAAA
jgi:DNA adenine methylase